MDVSYRWLRAVAPDLDADPVEVAEALAARGAPVEGIVAVGEGLDDVVVGRVLEVSAHPAADRLSLCSVDDGSGGEPLPVVCGAPNVAAGGLYPFAPVGATLPGGTAIGEAEIRGETSRGMLCSARELRLGTDQSGLLELPDGLEPGRSLVDALDLRDHRLDVEVTANRGDLLSHVGVARELVGEGALTLPDVPGGEAPGLELVGGDRETSASGVTIRIEDPDLCPRYLGAVVRGVAIGPSPAWLQARLRAAGSRPVNNVVDATNYVLLELGQPLHAFDLATLADHTVVVRRPAEGETRFTTLDGAERRLDPDMLLICDAREPVALAGVMGGLDSEVTDATTDVLLECALFHPGNIRSTRRALGMSTDASYRFERGVDPAGMERALARALEIIVATAGGTVEPRVADGRPRSWTPPRIELRADRVERVLGIAFTPARIGELLEPLGFTVESEEGGVLTVAVPGWRSYDVTREVDLIEEVARTHGFDAFPESLGAFRPGTVPDHPLFRLEDELRDALAGRGFFEVQTPAFVGASEGEVEVANPVSAEEAWMRRDLVPSVLRRVAYNLARGVADVRLFELGTSFRRAGPGEAPSEEPRLAVALTGRREPVHWSRPPEPVDLWDLKGEMEAALHHAGIEATVEGGVPDGSGLDPKAGFTASTPDGAVVAWGGRCTDDAVDTPAWAGPVYAFEVRLPARPEPRPVPAYEALPPYPAIGRDLALLVPDGVPSAAVAAAVRAAGGEHLVGVELFDRYRGEGVPDGTRSLAYRLRFQSADRTLTDEEIDVATQAVVEHLSEALGVQARG